MQAWGREAVPWGPAVFQKCSTPFTTLLQLPTDKTLIPRRSGLLHASLNERASQRGSKADSRIWGGREEQVEGENRWWWRVPKTAAACRFLRCKIREAFKVDSVTGAMLFNEVAVTHDGWVITPHFFILLWFFFLFSNLVSWKAAVCHRKRKGVKITTQWGLGPTKRAHVFVALPDDDHSVPLRTFCGHCSQGN